MLDLRSRTAKYAFPFGEGGPLAVDEVSFIKCYFILKSHSYGFEIPRRHNMPCAFACSASLDSQKFDFELLCKALLSKTRGRFVFAENEQLAPTENDLVNAYPYRLC